MSRMAFAMRSGDDSPVPHRRRSMLLMTVFAVCWAVVEYEFGRRLRQPYALSQIVWCRYASHLVIVGLIWGVRSPSRLWQTSRLRLQIGRSLLMLVMPLSFGAALAGGTDPANAWAVFWCAPILLLIFAKLLASERVSPLVWLMTTAASVAAVALVAPRGFPSGQAAFWAVLMAASFALYVVLTRMLRHESLPANLFYTAAGVFIPLTLVMPSVWATPSLHDAVVLGAIGALGFVALLALDRAAEQAEVSLSSAFITTQVAATLLLGWVRQPVAIGGLALTGVLVLCASLAVMWIVGSRERAQAAIGDGVGRQA